MLRSNLELESKLWPALRRIQRRLLAKRLLLNASFDLLIAASVSVALLVLDRILFPGVAALPLLAGVLALGALVSVSRTLLLNRPGLLAAALEADRALGLQERASSAVFLKDASLAGGGSAPAGDVRAEIARLIEVDASRCLERVSIQERFPIRPPRLLAWLPAPIIAAVALMFWLPSMDLLGISAGREAAAMDRAAAEEEKKRLEERLEELKKKAEKHDLPDAKKLLELLARPPEPPPKPDASAVEKPEPSSPGDPKKEALVSMTRREDAIKKGLEGKKFDPLKAALEAMKTLDLKTSDVTRKLQSALKDGDFEKAKEALADLKKEVSDLSSKKPSELTPAEKERLEKLAAELAKLSKDSKTLSKLSNALSRASSQLSGGGLSESLESLALSAEELASLEKLAQEMDLLEEALELVELSKEELASLHKDCPECGKPKKGKPGEKPGGT